MQSITCCIVGDSTVGKTSLLISYTSKQFRSEYIPTFFDHFLMDREIDSVPVKISFWDTVDQDGYNRIRPSSYHLTDVLLISFSLINLYSFENVRVKWNPEVMYFCPHIPKILVGTKLDLRDDDETISILKDKQFAPISYSQGLEMMRDIGAASYMECSALTQQGVTEVFDEAMRVAIEYKSHTIRKGRCSLL